MEAMIVALMFILMILFPVNGLIWLGMRAETIKKRNILKSAVKLIKEVRK